MTSATAIFRQGYIVDRRNDYIWFLALPFAAVMFALLAQEYLPGDGRALIAFFVTTPHHCATWLRVYGSPLEFQRQRERLILGPILLIGLAYGLVRLAPFALLLIVFLWDHQHSIMQQHGFARIYDFKAKSGAPWTPRWDFWLNWVLYGNMLLTMPLFTKIWVREFLRWHIPITVDAVHTLQVVSWTLTAVFACLYFGQNAWAVRRGYALNPYKYLFLFGSYFLWYFVSWHTGSVLVYGIAHRLMHGVQYIVIVYWFLRRRGKEKDQRRDIAARLVKPGNLLLFLGTALLYAFAFQLLTQQPLEQFGFGLVALMSHYQDVPETSGFEPMSYEVGYEMMAAIVINSVAMVHYYFDSFIWKVRERETQAGL